MKSEPTIFRSIRRTVAAAPAPTGDGGQEYARPNEQGMTLVEVMVSMLIVALTALAVVPMFALATSNNATGADYGTLTGMAMEEMERLIRQDYHHLVPGGSLESDVAGYSYVESDFSVRWQIEWAVDPAESKLVTVRVVGQEIGPLPARESTIATLRARP